MRIKNYIKLSEKYDSELIDEIEPNFAVVAVKEAPWVNNPIFREGPKRVLFETDDAMEKLIDDVYRTAKGRIAVSNNELYFTDNRDVREFVDSLVKYSRDFKNNYKLVFIKVFSTKNMNRALVNIDPKDDSGLPAKLSKILKLKV